MAENDEKRITSMLKKHFDAVIIGNGSFPKSARVRSLIDKIKIRVCCDGGANTFIEEGYQPTLIVGDGDSLTPENKEKYSSIFIQISEQETNDQTKAVKQTISFLKHKYGITHPQILIIGATGKREDHTIGNISLLATYLPLADIIMISDYCYMEAVDSIGQWEMPVGNEVTILNISANDFHSQGLQYPIYDFDQLWQGTLNKSNSKKVSITANGLFLVFIDITTLTI